MSSTRAAPPTAGPGPSPPPVGIGNGARRLLAGGRAWWFAPVARRRVAVLRVVVYSYIFVDLFVTTPFVRGHGSVPGEFYRPLLLGRLLGPPTPGPELVTFVASCLLVSAAVAATGRLPRLAGAAVFVLYLEWMLIAFSYGKVDHDRFAFLVALAVLPTVGRVSGGDGADERAGWAVRCVQVAVVLTYLLAAVAKLRYGGFEWVHSATLLRAILRRGTWLADPLASQPGLLVAAQYALVAVELSSPLLLVRGRVGRVALAAAFAFHAVTYSAIMIMFWPHVVCLLSFLPLERLRLPRFAAAGRSGAGEVRPASWRARPLPSR